MSNELIQQLTTIATLLTSVAALLTILEMRRQRTSQYLPTIVFEDQPVLVYKPADGTHGRDFTICPEGTEPSPEQHHGNLRLRLANVGAGPALDLLVSTSFDELAAAECLGQVDPKAAAGLIVDDLTVRFEASSHSSWIADRVHVHRLGTLMPSPTNPGPAIWVPLSYLELLCVYLRAVKPSVVTMTNMPMPPLRVSVQFRDRGGETRLLKFNVRLRLHYLSNGGGPIPELPGWEHCGAGELTVTAA